MKYLALFFVLLVFPVYADTLTGKVVKITDGDTVHVLLDSHDKEKIRLAGIDSPERKQPHGGKATKYLASLIGNKYVTVDYDKRDRYGRIVGKIIFKGTDINLEMVKAGYAWHYKKYQKEQSTDDRLSYAVAENNARNHGIGLFKDNNSIPPWQWRKNKKNLRKVKPIRKPQAQLLTSAHSNIRVWVNLKSGKYHCPDTRYFGNTKRGKIMQENLAVKSGYSGAHGMRCN